MSRLVLVRHGQASFFSDNYDKLSPLGEDQSRALARFWIAKGQRFDAAYSGSLVRQRRTAEVVAECYSEAAIPWPTLQELPGLNEYEADGIMEGLLPELCQKDDRFKKLKEEYEESSDESQRYRTFHRLLEAVMAAWVSGEYQSNGFEPWTAFSGRVRDALKTIMSVRESGQQIAVFSSGGPIGVSVQTALLAPEIKAAELNWRINNCSLTEFTFSGNRIALDSFNNVAHLTDPELLTYR